MLIEHRQGQFDVIIYIYQSSYFNCIGIKRCSSIVFRLCLTFKRTGLFTFVARQKGYRLRIRGHWCTNTQCFAKGSKRFRIEYTPS
jgi:hypothetical protein